MPDLAKDLIPAQQRLTEAAHALRQARNSVEGLSLAKPDSGLSEFVDDLTRIIVRVDGVSNHLRKMGAESKAGA